MKSWTKGERVRMWRWWFWKKNLSSSYKTLWSTYLMSSSSTKWSQKRKFPTSSAFTNVLKSEKSTFTNFYKNYLNTWSHSKTKASIVCIVLLKMKNLPINQLIRKSEINCIPSSIRPMKTWRLNVISEILYFPIILSWS